MYAQQDKGEQDEACEKCGVRRIADKLAEAFAERAVALHLRILGAGFDHSCPDTEIEQVEGDVGDCGVEHGLRPKDGGKRRIADKAHVAKGDGEVPGAALGCGRAHECGDHERDDCGDGIADDGSGEKREENGCFWQGLVCAHGGDDHAGQGDVHDESREGGVHLLVEKSRACGNDAANDGDAQGEHLQKDGHEGHGIAFDGCGGLQGETGCHSTTGGLWCRMGPLIELFGANGTTGGSVNDPGGLHLIAFNRQQSRMSVYTYARRNGNGRRARY